MDGELSEALALAEALARRAGAELLRRQGSIARHEVGRKSSGRDLVTAADLASEELLLEGLRRACPDDGVWAEESGASAAERARVWYLDPLDGTVNFVHGLPQFAVSVARVSGGTPDVAVVHAPALRETYSAVRGGGARLEGRPIRVSTVTRLEEALIATGFPYRRQFLQDDNLENFRRLYHRVRDLRRIGAAAVDLAYTAAGRLDAYWELHLGPYDVAAGGLLVQEAGGVADTIVPGGDWIHGRNIVAGPAALVAPLRAALLAGRGPDYPPLGEWAAPRA